MRSDNLIGYLAVTFVLITASAGALLSPASTARAQQPPFLITPYYGNEAITSRFDHEYPTYTFPPDNNNNIFTRHDGSRWIPPTLSRIELDGGLRLN